MVKNASTSTDIHDYEGSLRRGYKKLEEANTTEHNKELIRKFIDANAALMGVPRKAKYLYTLRYYAEWLNKDFEKVTKDELRDCITEKVENNEEITLVTKQHYKIMIRSFFKWLYDPDTPSKRRVTPEVVRWIEINRSKNKKKVPEELLVEDEVLKILDSESNPRNKAICAVLWNAGPRVSEFLTLRVKDVRVDKYGCSIHIWHSKTDARTIRLTFAAPYLLTWLELHKYKRDPNAWLWLPLNRGGYTAKSGAKNAHISYQALTMLLHTMSRKADVNKKVNPHTWRHSAATYDAKCGMPEAMMRHKYGWSQDSDMPSYYISLANKDIDEWELNRAGIDIKKEAESNLKPQLCRRCGHINEATNMYCSKCGLPLNNEAAVSLEAELEGGEEALNELFSNPESLKLLKEAIKIVERQKLSRTNKLVTIDSD